MRIQSRENFTVILIKLSKENFEEINKLQIENALKREENNSIFFFIWVVHLNVQ